MGGAHFFAASTAGTMVRPIGRASGRRLDPEPSSQRRQMSAEVRYQLVAQPAARWLVPQVAVLVRIVVARVERAFRAVVAGYRGAAPPDRPVERERTALPGRARLVDGAQVAIAKDRPQVHADRGELAIERADHALAPAGLGVGVRSR